MSTNTNNDLEFTPFNDTDQPRVEQLVLAHRNTKDGLDTSLIDPYRQGVSVRTNRHRYLGMQPKIGSGNPQHFTNTVTIGQPRDFTQFENDRKFSETPAFNPVQYITDPDSYPYPLQFNDGLQQSETATMEPLTLPSFKPGSAPTSAYQTYGFHGSLEDGNESVHLGKGNSRIEQFVDYDLSPRVSVPFLDEGEEYFASVRIEGFVCESIAQIEPYSDIEDEEIIRQLSTNDTDFLEAVRSLDFDLSEDIRGTFRKKSASAGISYVYGQKAGQYGTDSVAFANLVRGTESSVVWEPVPEN